MIWKHKKVTSLQLKPSNNKLSFRMHMMMTQTRNDTYKSDVGTWSFMINMPNSVLDVLRFLQDNPKILHMINDESQTHMLFYIHQLNKMIVICSNMSKTLAKFRSTVAYEMFTYYIDHDVHKKRRKIGFDGHKSPSCSSLV